jgi:predicted RNA-binding Zn-ribbon protein involved in translation (DUF1610 family)
MTGEDTWLDGNAMAGLLDEIFEAEMTTAVHVCRSCGTGSAVGAHRAYRSAGTVLRCPACGDVALSVAELTDRHVVRLTGAWHIEMPRR